jgi:hypothetical protein
MSEGKEDRSTAAAEHAQEVSRADDAAIVADVYESYDKKKFSWFHVKLIIISGMGFSRIRTIFSVSRL